MPTRHLASRISVAVAAAATALAAGSADADLDPGHEIIRTGDRVPGLGRVGRLIANPIGIDPDGRVFTIAYLDDGSRAVLKTRGGRLEPLWRQAEGGDADTPLVDSAVVSVNGTHVAALGGFQTSGSTVTNRWLYDLSSGTPTVILQSGDLTDDGASIVGFNSLRAVSDLGGVLVSAQLATPGSDPDTGSQVVLLHDVTGTHVVASAAPDAPGPLRFDFVQPNGIAADETAIVSACQSDGGCGVFRYRDGTLEPVLVAGDSAPDGRPITSAYALAVSSNGEVLANVSGADFHDLVVRTEGDRLVDVGDAAGPLPDGRLFTTFDAHLNARGDVTLEGIAQSPSSDESTFTVVLFPAGGTARVLPEPSRGGHLNDAGQIALLIAPPGERARVVRTDGRAQRTLVSVDSNTSDGASPIAVGLAGSCLADDGRVATFASGENGTQAWTCIDSTGPHLLAEASPYSQISFNSQSQCVFGSDDVVTLAGGVIARLGARADDILQVGEFLPDGGRVAGIVGVAANSEGTLVAPVFTEDGAQRLVRQTRGGMLELVTFHLDGGAEVTAVFDAGIADDGTIAAWVTLGTGSALVSMRGSSGRVLLDAGDLGEEVYFGGLLVRGTQAIVSLYRGGGGQRSFLYELGDGSGREILTSDTLPEAGVSARVTDFSRSGDLLYQTYIPTAFDSPSSTWRWHDGNSEQLVHVDSPYQPSTQPFRLNAAGDLLLFAPNASGGLFRLSLTGPPPSVACPGQKQSSASSDNGGCQTAAADAATAWPLLAPLLVLAAARRRRGGAGLETRATGTS